ncbi:hypothetical protein Lalb_Chr10g0102711 [Lupinus albus]|uniref:Uncharacterized protein n=1 Tax=Lupinus albus TaxID=3870 RepID=A0A6A4PWA0_LUPAL|nr:hypothetical protein Lalb_Chr10g0102711 [Lupinus albus]
MQPSCHHLLQVLKGRCFSHLHSGTTIHDRKLDTSRDSSSFRETDSCQRVGSNNFNVLNTGVSCKKSRERTD